MGVLYVTDVQVGSITFIQWRKLRRISGSKYNRDEAGNIILDWESGMPTSKTEKKYTTSVTANLN